MPKGIDNKTGHGNRYTHGETKYVDGKRTASPEYRSWQMMKDRCTNLKNNKYYRYGGRGITFDSRWDKFDNFLEDMGRRPSLNMTLERKDGDKSYCKDNCEWASKAQQSRNRAYVKLSVEIAASIRAATGRQVDIAARYGCTQTMVSNIKRGVSWGVEHGA